jgi:acetoin utilization protein AcuB
MTPDPYLVGPEMHLAEVASEMSENRYSSAAVMEGGQLIGIFTTIDALRALLLVLEGGPRRRRHDSAAI